MDKSNNSTKVLLGRKIRQLRKEKKWTQEYLSEMLEINPKSVLRIESGQTFPMIQNLEKLAEIFGIEVSDLFVNHNLEDVDVLKKYIYESIETFNEKEIRSLYNYIYSMKMLA